MSSKPDRATATAALYVVLSLGFAWLYWLAVNLSRRGVPAPQPVPPPVTEK